MKIYTKLLIGLGLIAIVFAGAMGFLVYQMTSIVDIQIFGKRTIAFIQDWNNVQVRTHEILLATDSLGNLDERWQNAISRFETGLEDLKQNPILAKFGSEVAEPLKNTEALWQLTRSRLSDTEIALNEFREIVQPKYNSLSAIGSVGLMEAFYNLLLSENYEPVDLFYFSRLKNAIKDITFSNEPFNNILVRLDDAVNKRIAELTLTTNIGSLVFIIVILLSSFVYLHFFVRNLARRIHKVEDSLRRVALRDFTSRPPALGTDEIGMLSNHLGQLVDSVGSFFNAVKLAVRKVTELKESLSTGTAESAAAVNQINQNIEGIKNRFVILDSAIDKASAALGDIERHLSSFKNDAENQSHAMKQAGSELNQATQAAAAVSERLGDQARSADRLKTIVLDGSERVLATNDLIRSISREVADIIEIIELIDQISDQTNILSMNAAIESAHAGAAGKGFAVVAEEIRKLAESTQENALRVDEALTSITGKIATALKTSETTAKAFDSVNADIVGFVGILDDIAYQAGETSAENVRVVSAIEKSIEATERFSAGTAEMYERYRAILDAMENIQAISDEAVKGIIEIDSGSQEILETVVHVNDISNQSRERVAELEKAMADFKTRDEAASQTVNDQLKIEVETDIRDVDVKSPPKVIL